MPLLVKKGSFVKAIGAAPVSQSESWPADANWSAGGVPKALILWTDGQAAEGIELGIYESSYGFSDGSTDYAISGTNSITGDASRRQAAKVLSIIGQPAGRVTRAECDLTSFDANGFTVNWTINDAQATVIHYLALGGSDLANVFVGRFTSPVAAGIQAVAGVGFQPDTLLFFGAGAPGDGTLADLRNCIGMATGPNNEGVVSISSPDATPQAESYQRLDRCVADTALLVRDEAEFVSMDVDGFSLNWTTLLFGSGQFGFLALRGDQYDVGSEFSPNSPQLVSTAGVGFRPLALFMAGWNKGSAVTSPTPRAHLSVGAATATGEGVTTIGDRSRPPLGEIEWRSNITTKAMRHIDVDVPVGPDDEADLDSFDADGFTLDWTTADATQRQFLYWAIGGTPPPPPPGPSGGALDASGSFGPQVIRTPPRMVGY